MSIAPQDLPTTLPLTVGQYETLVEAGAFEGATGQIELIRGRIVRMNPQGPEHADPIDVLSEWSFETTKRAFTVRIEKPLRLPELNSCPEPDIAWVTRSRYHRQHPHADEVHLLIEVSYSSGQFDRTEKLQLYAEAGIREYWRVDVPSRSIDVHRDPVGDRYQSVTTHDRSATIRPLCLPSAALTLESIFPPGNPDLNVPDQSRIRQKD